MPMRPLPCQSSYAMRPSNSCRMHGYCRRDNCCCWRILLAVGVLMAEGSCMTMNRAMRSAPLLFVSILPLCGCNKTDDTATLSVAVADTPADNATSVFVTFTGVELQGQSNVPVLYRFSTPK